MLCFRHRYHCTVQSFLLLRTTLLRVGQLDQLVQKGLISAALKVQPVVIRPLTMAIVSQVSKGLFEAILAGVKQRQVSVLGLMEDSVRVRQVQMDREALQKLEKAFAELKKI